jgi:hypothetical protein
MAFLHQTAAVVLRPPGYDRPEEDARSLDRCSTVSLARSSVSQCGCGIYSFGEHRHAQFQPALSRCHQLPYPPNVIPSFAAKPAN